MRRPAFFAVVFAASVAPSIAFGAQIDRHVTGSWHLANGAKLVLAPNGFFAFNPFAQLVYRGRYVAIHGRYRFAMGAGPMTGFGTYARRGGYLTVTTSSGARYAFAR